MRPVDSNCGSFSMMSVVGLFAFKYEVVLPVFAKDTFHGTGGTYGC